MSDRPNRKRERQAERRHELQAAAFARCFHSEERVAFISSLPCIGCGHRPCQNAHIETGGMARRADYTKIVPLCGPHLTTPSNGRAQFVAGCHAEIHNHGIITFTRRHEVNLVEKAAETEEAWQKHLAAR